MNAAAQQDMVSGVVESIDKADGKIRLKHGPIKSLGMDVGMTMSFECRVMLMPLSISPSSLSTLACDSAVHPPNLGVLGLVNQSEIRAKG